MSALRDWLRANGLDQYSDEFHANGIDVDVIGSLDDADLRELGLNLGDRKRFLAAITTPNKTESSAERSLQAEPTEAERRQLTVLFCDMVGFTELASRLDPEVLQTIVRDYEDTCAVAITRYDGYVFQRLGDGIVAFFGYPLAHEGEAERAIRAGLDIVDALSTLEAAEAGRIDVRIGIATGMVVVASAEKGAVGETMNLASRLQSIAPVNTVVVSERVQRLAGGAFDYDNLGEQSLKGIARPTHAYRVLGVSKATSRFEAAQGESLAPLVGRDLELGLLMDRWALAQEGEGQAVLLCGEPGIGKSRTLNALRERLEGEGVKSLRFQCSPYYVNSAFWPSINNFERALKLSRDETSESKLDKLESLIVGHYERPLSDLRFIASMLSIPCHERYGEVSMTPQKFKDETLRTLVDLTEAAARKRPSVLLFEDMHWADPSTLEVLDLLVDRVKDIPLLIVLTHRPEFQNRWSDHGHVSAVNLSKLTRSQSRAMVSGLTGGKALPSELLEQILAKTDGVPLFVEELTKSILESGELTDEGDHYAYAGTNRSVTIPSTLRDSLMSRLDRYLPVKQIAQIGAAMGRTFSYELLSVVGPLQESERDEALTQLTDSGLAFRRGTPPDATYTFKHALVQDAAYDSLLKSKRRELHDKIAKALEARFPETSDTEPEVLAHHLTIAGRSEDAIPLWQKAGELALKRWALAEAIAHFARGLELVEKLPKSRNRDGSELALRVPMGMAWMALDGWPAPEIWTSLHPALSLAKSLGRNDLLLPILAGLRVNVQTRGRLAEGLSWAQEMLDTAKATGDQDLLIGGHTGLCVCYFWMGKLAQCLEHGHEVMALYDAEKCRHFVDLVNHDPRSIVGGYISQSTWMLGYPDQAVELSEATVAHARQIDHPFDLGFTLHMEAGTYVFRREPEETRKRAQETERLGRANRLPVLSALLAPENLALASLEEGNPAEALAQLDSFREKWLERAPGNMLRTGSPIFVAMALTGHPDEALQLIEEQIEEIERPGREQRVHYSELLRLKGWVLTLRKDLAGAEENYLASLDWAREQQAKSWELRTSTSLARLWQQQGKHKEAHDLLEPIYNWFTEGFDTKDLKEAKALLEELEVTA